LTVDVPMLFVLFTSVIYLLMLSVTKTVVLNDLFIVNIELERIWKEAVMAQFKVVFWHVHVGTEENLSLCPLYPD
jgi:hypothetical protein